MTASRDTDTFLEVDLLVVGGGMAGMTAAAFAAQQGAHVIVLEKADAIGGSAGLSEGYVWTAPTLEVMRTEDPQGTLALSGYVVGELEEGLAWIGSLGVHVGDLLTDVLGFGSGRQIDVWEYMRVTTAIVEGNGGFIVPRARARELIREDGAVAGALVDQDGEDVVIRAYATVLATGGFQGDAELVRQHIQPTWSEIVVRANPVSAGDGLRLGIASGGSTSSDMGGFYGHLMPRPLARPLTHTDYTALAQYHSEHGVLVNTDGRRFLDESLGDHWCAQAVAVQSEQRAVLFCDERIRREVVMAAFVPGMQQGLDKFEAAADAGAHSTHADTLEGLRTPLDEWGYDGATAVASAREFTELVECRPEALAPGRRRLRRALAEPPFYAIEVQPAITFTYGGLRTDEHGRVLDDAGEVVPGLFAAGADQGGVYHRGYAGGLSRALVFGRRAGAAALVGLRAHAG